MAVKNYNTINGLLIGENVPGSPSATLDYACDALGSVVATIGTNGLLAQTFRYAGYGQVVSRTGGGMDPKFLWNGASGVRALLAAFYARIRHYLPSLGSWTSAGRYWPHQVPYSYGRGNPASFSDPYGQTATLRSMSSQRTGPHPLRSARVGVGGRTRSSGECDPCRGGTLEDVCMWATHLPDFEAIGGGEEKLDFLGKVVCCDGQPYICVWINIPSEAIKKCIREHESSHLSDYQCKEDGFLEPPNAIDGWRSECYAYRKSILCLNAACANDTYRGFCRDALCSACRMAQLYCGKVGIGFPEDMKNICGIQCGIKL